MHLNNPSKKKYLKRKTTYKSLCFLLFVSVNGLFAQDWNQIGEAIEGEEAFDFSGYSVATNALANRVVIGAIGNDGAGDIAGNVRVFEWMDPDWIQLGDNIDGENPGDLLGFRVVMNEAGNIIATAGRDNDNNGFNSGHIRAYQWNGSNWIQLGIAIEGENANDRSGRSLAMNRLGTRIAIGASENDANGMDAGHARIYEWDGANWILLGSDIDGEIGGGFFGYSITLNDEGDRLAVGAIHDNGIALNAGSVTVYNWDGSDWVQLGEKIEGGSIGDKFGSAVALDSSGNRLVITAINQDDNGVNAGQAKVYEWDGFNWGQLGENIEGEAESDEFGATADINSQGNVIAVGARFNGGGPGIGKGHIKVYQWDGLAWKQKGTDLDGEAADNEMGRGLALDKKGDRIVTGAPLNKNAGENAGHVRVFYFDRGVTELVDLIKKKQLNIYPNPTNTGFVNIDFSQFEEKEIQFKIIDPFGNLIFEKSIENSTEKIDLTDLSRGVYFFQIGETTLKKIIYIYP